ncbi:AraC family transcriptional regulator [Paenibacillus wenxiniae]|uniref:AraC family transcriptional regulator N-terminal domain-containing protein n=1 Tax=Paenibacillus wenxiniae TaxID=1636843 RepID=A0ABW4RPT1_9BACL
MSESIYTQHAELAALIRHHCPEEGLFETAIPSLFLIHHRQMTERAYNVYKPCFCCIAGGTKDIFLANEHLSYGPTDYLIASMNLPIVGQVVQASPAEPYLSFKLEFSQNQILEVLNETDLPQPARESAKRALFVGQTEQSLLDAVIRLTRLLDQPKDIPFLAPLFIKEILYKLLQGSFGTMLAQIALEGSSSYRIREVIEQITRHYEQPLRVEELAELASMSVSSFHRNFKEVTAMSPLQFQKQVRLQEARRILLSESADAADVAFRVGYESASQFSREYARMFGAPPRADIKQLKQKYGTMLKA